MKNIKEKVLERLREEHKKQIHKRQIVNRKLKKEDYLYCKKCEDGLLFSERGDRESIEIHIEPFEDIKEAIDLTLAEVGKVIDKFVDKEKFCMKRDKYPEQEVEHINQIEMANKILLKIRGDGK